jgi:GNAT superfamily N-acetyltransferase
VAGVDDLLAAVAGRWRALDPALAAPRPPYADQEVLAGRGMLGAIRCLSPEPGMPAPLWFAAHRFSLRPLVTEPVESTMDALVARWRDRIAAEPMRTEPDSAGYVWVPSREPAAFPALARHGLAAYSVVAIRPAGRAAPPLPAVPVRQAGPADLDVLTDLALAQLRAEAAYGGAYARPTAAEQIRADLGEALAAEQRWMWLAERDGAAVGVLTATPPPGSLWLAPFTDIRPLAYLSLAYVVPGSRDRGVGAALAGTAHAAFDAAGISATLLHYALTSPWSGPFWHRQGYRPLWTGWQARPASTLR